MATLGSLVTEQTRCAVELMSAIFEDLGALVSQEVGWVLAKLFGQWAVLKPMPGFLETLIPRITSSKFVSFSKVNLMAGCNLLINFMNFENSDGLGAIKSLKESSTY